MKKRLLFLFFVLLFTSAQATPAGDPPQSRTYNLSGRIVDAATGEVLPGAFIVILDTDKQTAADEKGTFQLRSIPLKDTLVEISYVGYKTIVQSIKPQNNLNLGDIKLATDALDVGEIVVQGTPPIAIQLGDTTQFNAGAFKTNPDATAEDLLKKMPGFTVQDGQVETQGETIARVYVDGKPFFDDDPLTALRTLPSDVVESIQLFDEKSEESKFTGYDDGNTAKTINIVTTRKSKLSTFGRISAAYGTDDRYLVTANSNIFTDQHRWTIAVGSNNLNQLGFSMSDLTGSSGGNNRGNGGRGGQSGDQTTSVIGLNYSGELGKERKTKLSGNYFFYSSQTERERLTQQTYFPTDNFDSRYYESWSLANNRSNTHRLNMRLEADLNENNRIVFVPRGTLQFNNNGSLNRSINELNGLMSDSTQNRNRSKMNGYNLSGDLTWMHKFGKAGRTLTTTLNFSASDRDNQSYLQGMTRFYEDEWIYRDTIQNQYTTNQNYSNDVRLRLAYTEPLTEYARLIFNYTGSYNWSESDKKTLLYDEASGMYERLDTTLTNFFKRDYVINGAGAGYTYHKDRITLNVGVDYEYSQMFNRQEYPRYDKSDYGFHSVLPNVRFTYSVDRTKNLHVNYRGNSNLPSVSQLQNVIDNSNQLQVTMGNPNLKQGYQHNLWLRYSVTNLSKSTTTNFNVSVTNNSNYITTERRFLTRDTTIMGAFIPKGAQVSAPLNLNGYWSVRGGAGYSFAIKPLKININTNLNYGYTRRPSKYDGQLSYTNSHDGRFRFSISSNISENIDFNIYSMTSYTYANSTGNVTANSYSNRYVQEQAGINLNWIFWKDLVFNTDYNLSFNAYPGQSTPTEQSNMLNVSLGKKFLRKKQAEIRVSAYDLLNQNKSIFHSVNANYVEDSFSNVLKRYFMLTFNYKFNTMGSRTAPAQPSQRGEGMRSGPPAGGRPGGPPGGRF